MRVSATLAFIASALVATASGARCFLASTSIPSSRSSSARSSMAMLAATERQAPRPGKERTQPRSAGRQKPPLRFVQGERQPLTRSARL
jgi:hypothetical protein